MNGFLAELKRRNVIRMAGLYLVGAWLLVQVAGTVLPMFGAPDWLPRSIVILLAIGFLPALIFSWVFELTQHGLKRDEDVTPEESIAPQTARRMNRAIIAVLVLALAYFCFDKFALAPRREAALIAAAAKTTTAPVAPPAGEAVSKKSIAVLPFTDLSPGRDQEYFSDGMAEEILDALAQVQDLKVAGRTSSFYFKGKNEDLRTIGKTLGVADLLEGSVRKQGDKVRVTAQLIQASDGFHLWSESYDGDLSNVFELQERIARAITDQLKVVLVGEQKTRLVPVSTSSSEAYALYLQARSAYRARGDGVKRSIDLYHAALERDPKFAPAWAGLCGSLNVLQYYLPENETTRIPQILSDAEVAGKRAIELAPDLASPHIMLANLYTNEWRWALAEQHFQRAQALAPSDPEFYFAYTDWLGAQGRCEEALQAAERAVTLDPLAPMYRNLYGYLLDYSSRYGEAITQLQAGYALAPTILYISRNLFGAYILAGRIDEAEKLNGSVRAALIAGGESEAVVAKQDAVREAIVQIARDPGQYDAKRKALGADGPILARVFTKHIDDLFLVVERLIEQHETGVDPVVLLRSPLFADYRNDPRYLRLLQKVGFDEAGNIR